MMNRTVALAALLVALVFPARAAELRAVGPEHVVSGSYCGALAVRDSGRYAVGWVQSDPVHPDLALVVQVVDEDDVALPAVEVEPSIVSLPLDASLHATDSGFALQWYEHLYLGPEASVRIQNLDVAGLPVPPPFVAPGGGARTYTPHASGGRVITEPARDGILVRVEDAAGRPLGRPVSIGDRHVVWRHVRTRPDGGFVVFYGSRQRVDNRQQDLGVRAVAFDREGRLASPPVLVARPRTFLVAFAVGADGTLAAIVRSANVRPVTTLRTFDRRGRVLGSLQLPDVLEQALGLDRLGNVLMVWTRNLPGEVTAKAQLFSRRLQPLAAPIALAAVPPALPRGDTCLGVAAAADSFVVSWTRFDGGTFSEIRAQRLALAD